ncbi:MAG: hypothetical protein IKQ95_10395 [Synergistaceae bacterium]|nr:hypothetical protein [Synergistaceae bacterium]
MYCRVMGTGRIGTTVIQHLSGFGCRILAYDVHENETARKFAQYADRDTIFRESDIITLHMNANDDNYHIIGHEAVAKMKPGAYVINTARGKLVDSDAIIAEIESGKLGGAALDVLEHENGLYYYNRMGEVIVNQKLAVLRSFPNVILSPHTAFTRLKMCAKWLKEFSETVTSSAQGKKRTELIFSNKKSGTPS